MDRPAIPEPTMATSAEWSDLRGSASGATSTSIQTERLRSRFEFMADLRGGLRATSPHRICSKRSEVRQRPAAHCNGGRISRREKAHLGATKKEQKAEVTSELRSIQDRGRTRRGLEPVPRALPPPCDAPSGSWHREHPQPTFPRLRRRHRRDPAERHARPDNKHPTPNSAAPAPQPSERMP